MGLFDKFKQGLQKTHQKLVGEIKRIVTFSPKMTEEQLEELEATLLGADLGLKATTQIVEAVRKAYESQGGGGLDVLGVARQELEKELPEAQGLKRVKSGPTVISIVGVNGTGKTTTAAKLAAYLKNRGDVVVMAACDTFRAAAIEQLKIWGQRLDVPVVASAYGADPAAVAHDAVAAGMSRGANYVLIDTAGRLHTKHNLMQELQKVHRVMTKLIPDAPHETLLVVDATTGMNALTQAREFDKAVTLTGLIVTKLDGTSKGGVVIAVGKDTQLPVKFIGVGEAVDDLQPYEPREFTKAMFAAE
ncbi:MAG TPA: signal recognition particle-docking protein FtsY [Methylomirabilota bacterium]|nr:signal recognition particle-docking protein FtsY [Methylomirabilota bacterium]